MKNKTKRRIYSKFHSVKRKHKKTKRKYYSKYRRNKRNKINNLPQRFIKKNILSYSKDVGEIKIETIENLVEDTNWDEDVSFVQRKAVGSIEAPKNAIQENNVSCYQLTEESIAMFGARGSNSVEIPQVGLIVGYDWVFDDPVPKTREERLRLIQHIPKKKIIYNVASFNYLQREFNSFTYDISDELQWANLTFWLNTLKSDMYKKRILQYLKRNDYEDKSVVLFNRQANLFILQEVIYYGSDVDMKDVVEPEVMEDIFKYYLSVNSLIVNEKEYEQEDTEDDNEEAEKKSDLKKLVASNLYIDTLRFVNNPIFTLERYPGLIQYLRSKPELNKYFANYFSPFGYDPEQLLKYIAEFYFNLPKREPSYLAPFISIPTDDPQRIQILDSISELHHEIDLKHDFDLSRIKKSPLYKVPGEYYVILDHDFLIQKLYQFAINDYFFDYLKPNDAVNYAYYAAEIGLFFENYVSEILKKTFKGQEVTLKTLDELKTQITGSEIELADFYIREGNNIILGQVKASALNTEQNRGAVESLFTKDKNFLGDFGLLQTFDTIQHLKTYPKEFDSQLEDGVDYNIYPVIVLNEAITSSLAVHLLFDDELQSMLVSDSFPNFRIKHVILLHIQDLERISPSIEKGTHKIWDILDSNMVKQVSQPLDITLDRLGITHIPIKKITDYKFMKFANCDGEFN